MLQNRASSLHGGRNDDIEILRAVAVLLTLACHFGNLLHWDGNWSNALKGMPLWGGVDLFFCISGFVIASSLLRQQRAGTFAQLGVPFYLRRIFRIWPAALLWLLVPLVAAHYFNVTGAFGSVRGNLPGSAAAVAQVANFYSMVCQPSLAAHLPCGKPEIYWSLSLEEQFYLVFPLLLYFLRRSTVRAVLVALVCVQFFLFRPVESPLWNLRTDAICLGVLIALAMADGILPSGRLAARRSLSGWLAVGLIACVAALPAAQWLRVNVGLLAFVSAALVLIASENANLILPIGRARPLLLWVGSRSYAIYLVHDPCYWATREIFQRLDPHAHFSDAFAIPFIVTAFALIALTSDATYRLVETPLRNLGRNLASRYERGLPVATPPTVPAAPAVLALLRRRQKPRLLPP